MKKLFAIGVVMIMVSVGTPALACSMHGEEVQKSTETECKVCVAKAASKAAEGEICIACAGETDCRVCAAGAAAKAAEGEECKC